MSGFGSRTYSVAMQQPWALTAGFTITCPAAPCPATLDSNNLPNIEDVGEVTVTLDPNSAKVYPSAQPVTSIVPAVSSLPILVPPSVGPARAVQVK
ncbi:MAG TPA: hypothetical protein VKU19_08515 [Bryobacteraceae bacterium]|nr:hypothetical protein [Bryobacteraceae bacterium]